MALDTPVHEYGRPSVCLVSAHERGQTEHAVLTRYHGRDCTQREHERVHEHKRYVVIPLRPERRVAQSFVHGW